MSLYPKTENGEIIRKAITVDCSDDKIIVEQSHKDEVDINNIVKRHGMDLIQKTAMLQTPEYLFDELPYNDFQEAHLILAKAEQQFQNYPHQVREQFDNNPARFLDFVQNPENKEALVNMGLATAPPEVKAPEPVPVIIAETPPPEGGAA